MNQHAFVKTNREIVCMHCMQHKLGKPAFIHVAADS